jgi:hypothetical protein
LLLGTRGPNFTCSLIKYQAESALKSAALIVKAVLSDSGSTDFVEVFCLHELAATIRITINKEAINRINVNFFRRAKVV